MSNLTVSSAVFDLLQATDQAGMQSAIGAGAPPFALAANDNVVTVSGHPAVALDSNGNPYLAQTNGDQSAEFCFDNNGNPAISNDEGQHIFQVDDNGNPIVQGGDAGDQIGFSSGGVASVTAAADGLQLPITRTVGLAMVSINGLAISPGTTEQLEANITGCELGDAYDVTFDSANALGVPSGTGGVGLPWLQPFTNGVYVTFVNSDPDNFYTFTGNMYIKVTR